MQGKICLVTGATLGIGFATALGLARLGAHVVMVGRDAARTKAAAERIRRDAGADGPDFLIADLSSPDEVRQLAHDFKERYPRLDVLVNNAGGIFTKREVTAAGIERTWALNHLAYVVLTLELLDLLKASAPARIVNVASELHKRGRMDFGGLQGEQGYNGLRAYNQSKLANVLFTCALARRLEGTGVTANCLHPGVIASGFGHEASGPVKIGLTLIRPFLASPDKGAKTSIYLASSPEVEGVNGLYFKKCRPSQPSPLSADVELQERLWEISLRQTGCNVTGARTEA
jgi:retinol dehydrogenase 12